MRGEPGGRGGAVRETGEALVLILGSTPGAARVWRTQNSWGWSVSLPQPSPDSARAPEGPEGTGTPLSGGVGTQLLATLYLIHCQSPLPIQEKGLIHAWVLTQLVLAGKRRRSS